MEVGDHAAHDAKLEARQDEERRVAPRTVLGLSVPRPGLERANRGRAHRDHAPAATRVGALEGSGGFGRYTVGLGIEGVLLRVLGRHGPEGTRTHVEGEKGDLEPALAD